jgi:hypothetical protein
MSQVTDTELLERAEEVARKADAYKELIFAHEIFKHKSKAYLASLKISFVSKGSDAAQETSALATLEWTKFLDKEMETLKNAGRAKMELEAAQVRFEAMRSALSARKAEVRSFG